MENTSNSTAWREIVAGSIGGCTGILSGQPFDTVKARLQSQGVGSLVTRYNSTGHCLLDIIKTEGVRGLYKGMSYPLLGQVFINATVFSVHGSCMRILQPDGGHNSVPKSTLAGFIAGSVQCIICSPMELIKLKMQVQGIGMELTTPMMASVLHSKANSAYRGPWVTTKAIYRQQGIRRGLMKGFVPTLCREGPSFAVYFGSYDFIRQRIAILFRVPLDQLGIPYLFLSGGIAGCLTWMSTYPFDVIKTRIQLDTMNSYGGMIDCFSQSVASDGYRVLFRGLSSALYRAFSTNAVTLTTVTIVLQYWEQYSNKNTITRQ